MLRIAFAWTALVVAAWSLSPPASAYLDPGAGSALLQGIIGSVALATGFIAYQWHRVRDLLLGSRKSDVDPRQPRA